jgi:hypothetical protein
MSGNGNNGSKWITPERRLGIYLRDGFRCMYCGRGLRNASRREVTLDHLVPRCEGGNNRNENLVTACLRCNSQRGKKAWEEYATGGAIDRIKRQIGKVLNMDLAKGIIAGNVGDPRVESER